MSWINKLESLRAHAETDFRLVVCSTFVMPGASDGYIRRIFENYPFVSPSYTAFLTFTNGAQLDVFVFFGADESPFGNLLFEQHSWIDLIGDQDALVIGSDASGDAVVIKANGSVHLVESDPPSRTRTLAQSFDDYMDQVILGPKYLELYPVGTRKTSEWIDILREHGWLESR